MYLKYRLKQHEARLYITIIAYVYSQELHTQAHKHTCIMLKGGQTLGVEFTFLGIRFQRANLQFYQWNVRPNLTPHPNHVICYVRAEIYPESLTW